MLVHSINCQAPGSVPPYGVFPRKGQIMRSVASLVALGLLFGLAASAGEPPWTTYRGNSQRTGNTDNKPGPVKPNVLWFVKSKDQYLSSPVPAGNRLFVSGLGGINTAVFACLDPIPRLPSEHCGRLISGCLPSVRQPLWAGRSSLATACTRTMGLKSCIALDLQTGKRRSGSLLCPATWSTSKVLP